MSRTCLLSWDVHLNRGLQPNDRNRVENSKNHQAIRVPWQHEKIL